MSEGYIRDLNDWKYFFLYFQGLNPGKAIGEIKKMLLYYNTYKSKLPMNEQLADTVPK